MNLYVILIVLLIAVAIAGAVILRTSANP